MEKKFDFGIRKIIEKNGELYIKLPRLMERNFQIKKGMTVRILISFDGKTIILEVQND